MGEMDMGDMGSMDGLAESSTMFWGASAWPLSPCRALLLSCALLYYSVVLWVAV